MDKSFSLEIDFASYNHIGLVYELIPRGSEASDEVVCVEWRELCVAGYHYCDTTQ